MNTRYGKTKGARLENWVTEMIRTLFSDTLENDDILPRGNSRAGCDIILTPAARKLVKFSIECKNHKVWSARTWIEQAKENVHQTPYWMVVAANPLKRGFINSVFIVPSKAWIDTFGEPLDVHPVSNILPSTDYSKTLGMLDKERKFCYILNSELAFKLIKHASTR